MAMTEEEKAIYSWPSDTQEQREAQVAALIALAEDPTHPYDAHHGSDRSPEGLEHLRLFDPTALERVLGKIVAGT